MGDDIDPTAAEPEMAPAAPKKTRATHTLDEAVLAVMRAVPYILKTGKMTGAGSYTYASDADLIAKLHPAMLKHGLTMKPARVRLVYQEQYTTKAGAAQNRVGIIVRYRLSHAPSGTSEMIEAMGEGCDSGDKSASKAMTSAHKYALRQAFNIQTGDDPDKVSSEDLERASEIKSEKKAEAAAFLAAARSVEQAANQRILNKLRVAYKDAGRGFSDGEIAELDKLYAAREKTLKEQESKKEPAAAQ